MIDNSIYVLHVILNNKYSITLVITLSQIY